MQNQFDYRRYAILYVDDEEKSLKNFARGFGEDFRILTANNAQEGLALIEREAADIGLLMTDQRMPGESGVWLLEHVRRKHPGIMRVLATAYSDYEVAIAAVNNGSIYKFINKPFDPAQLEQTLKRGLEFFVLQKERDELLREKLSILHNMMIADRLVSLGLLAAGLSHHIRNSLQAVRTFLDLAPSKMEEERAALDGLRDPEFWKSYYHLAQGQISRIQELLSELWSASDSPKSQFSDTVNLANTFATACEKLGKELAAKRINVENQIPSGLPTVLADAPKIARLFELLLKDELTSLPEGSRITVTAEACQSAGKAGVTVVLHDNGPGLPEESLRSLFDPFMVRSDAPGEFGINLMACFFIVYHHGGVIRAESTVGVGTKFSVHLPSQPDRNAPLANDRDFLEKAVMNEELWKKLIAS
jgi:two-component system probable response regulator PhcQ